MGLYCNIHNINSIWSIYNKHPVICCLDYGKVERYFDKFSDEMADKLNYGMLNELQFDEVVDNKGVLKEKAG